MARSLNREEWQALVPRGPRLDLWTTIRPNGDVEIDDREGLADALVCMHEDGVDVRVGEVQFIVSHRKVSVVHLRPPFPINEYVVLWEGEIA